MGLTVDKKASVQAAEEDIAKPTGGGAAGSDRASSRSQASGSPQERSQRREESRTDTLSTVKFGECRREASTGIRSMSAPSSAGGPICGRRGSKAAISSDSRLCCAFIRYLCQLIGGTATSRVDDEMRKAHFG